MLARLIDVILVTGDKSFKYVLKLTQYLRRISRANLRGKIDN